MELFVWLWLYDKRLLCGRGASVTYAWLIPVFSALTVLIMASRLDCDENPMVMASVENDFLSELVLVQKSLLVGIVLTGLAAMAHGHRQI